MIVIEKPSLEEVYLSHIDTKPWSDYTKADYTPEQWHRACLVHIHQGTPTSKDQCKIPVRTPNGEINRNGVQAAAAALAGARGGVNASPEKTSLAKRAVSRLYSQLGEKAPSSLSQSIKLSDEDLLIHFGIRGMKWGVRKRRSDEGERKKIFTKQNAKKAAIGAAVLGGAAATVYILARRGNTKVPKIQLKNPTASDISKLNPIDASRSRASIVGPAVAYPRARTPFAPSQAFAPSPFEMQMAAGRAAHANSMRRVGSQKLTRDLWVNQSRLNLLTKEMDKTPLTVTKGTADRLAEIRRQLDDPNHVWEL
jgi:hypothetical protein